MIAGSELIDSTTPELGYRTGFDSNPAPTGSVLMLI